MENVENKIKLEDITFEDMIDEGLKESPAEEIKEESAPEASLEDKSIDEDIEEKKEEIEIKEVKEEVKIEEPKEVEIKEWQEKGDELSLIEIEKALYDRQRITTHVEAAFKQLAVFQEAYEEICKNNNIPADWDEEDAERDEIRHHVRQAFRQSHRDMTLTGSISQGNAEYLEQYGIQLQTAKHFIAKYISTCEKMLEENAVPNINHYYEFLDSVVKVFGEEYKKVLKHMGIDNLVRQDLLYKSTNEFS